MIVVYNVFNVAKTIRKSLLSILPYVNKVIVVDGAYKRFPHKKKSGASTDGTKKIFRRLCKSKLVWVSQRKPKSQVAKKNFLFKHIPKGKWFLRLAGDEVITGKVAKAFKFAESSKFTNIGVPIKNFHPVWYGYKVRYVWNHVYIHLSPPIPRKKWGSLEWKSYFGVGNRIVKKQRGLHFRGHHSTMFAGKKLMRVQNIVKNLLITNMPHKVGWERWHQKIKYKKKRNLEQDFEG